MANGNTRETLNEKTKGITLLEILLGGIIVFITLLSVQQISSALIKYIKKTETEKRVKEIRKGIELFFLDLSYFPPSLTNLNYGVGIVGWKGPYTSLTINELREDGFGNLWYYSFLSSPTSIALLASAGRNRVFETSFSNWPTQAITPAGDDIVEEISVQRNEEIKIMETKMKLKTIAKAIYEYFMDCSTRTAPTANYGCVEYALQKGGAIITVVCSSGISPCIAAQEFPPGHGIRARRDMSRIGCADFDTGIAEREPNSNNNVGNACADQGTRDYLCYESTEEIIIKNANIFDPFIRAGALHYVYAKSHFYSSLPSRSCQYAFHSAGIVAPGTLIGCGGGVGAGGGCVGIYQGPHQGPGYNTFRYPIYPVEGDNTVRILTVGEGGVGVTCSPPPSNCPAITERDADDVVFSAVPPNFGNCFPKNSTWYIQLGFPSQYTLDAWGQPIRYFGCQDTLVEPGYPPSPNCQDYDFPGDVTDPPFEAVVWTQDPFTGEVFSEIVTAVPSAPPCGSQLICDPEGGEVTIRFAHPFGGGGGGRCMYVWEAVPGSTSWSNVEIIAGDAGGSRRVDVGVECGNMVGVTWSARSGGTCVLPSDSFFSGVFWANCSRMAYFAGDAAESVFCR